MQYFDNDFMFQNIIFFQNNIGHFHNYGIDSNQIHRTANFIQLGEWNFLLCVESTTKFSRKYTKSLRSKTWSQ